MKIRSSRLVAVCAAFFLIASGIAPAKNRSIDQNVAVQVKENLLYHFTNLMTWPDGAFARATDPIVICVLGTDPYGMTQLLEERSRWMREAEATPRRHRGYDVRHYAPDASSPGGGVMEHPDRLRACHILYVNSSETRERDWLAALRGQATVTVGEGREFIRDGGMIAFFIKQNRLRCAVDLEALTAAKIKISAQMLQHVEIVRSAP